MQVERRVFVAILGLLSGERVRNALVTCPEVWDNSSKGLLIPHADTRVRGFVSKAVMRFGRDLRPIS
jgi:hypothetical protein